MSIYFLQKISSFFFLSVRSIVPENSSRADRAKLKTLPFIKLILFKRLCEHPKKTSKLARTVFAKSRPSFRQHPAGLFPDLTGGAGGRAAFLLHGRQQAKSLADAPIKRAV